MTFLFRKTVNELLIWFSFNAKIRITESLEMGYISLFSDPKYRPDISPQGSRREIRKINSMLLIATTDSHAKGWQ